ncbi:uncharacterized protein LOC141914917 [Tubulanus polymorphus]|uniref:uncharacterized protein LOC141914917 n=1 Tax=Tubulanus polymorphus TaxID=672921 RepID=UPI003DA292C5
MNIIQYDEPPHTYIPANERRVRIDVPPTSMERWRNEPSLEFVDARYGQGAQHPTTPNGAILHLGEVNPAFDADSSVGSQQRLEIMGQNRGPPNGNTPVYYQTKNGKPSVHREHVVKTNRDGIRVVVTSDRQNWVHEHSLKEKDLKCYFISSIIAVILFFPSGIPAIMYAMRAKREFYAGIERGEIETAIRYAKLCERLIVISVVGFVIWLLIVLVVVEIGIHQHHLGKGAGYHTIGRGLP